MEMKIGEIVFAAAVFSATFAFAAPSHPLRIMPLGDSITYGSHGQATAGYRGPLYELLKEAGYNIDYVGTDGGTQGTLPDSDHEHEGHSGWCTANVPGVRRQGVYDFLPISFSRILAPNIILLHIGTNDAEDKNSMPGIVERYRKLLERIFESQPSAWVVMTTVLERKDKPKDALICEHFNPFVPKLAAEYAAKGKRVKFLDMRSFLTIDVLDDNVHPNVEGYAMIAKAWFGAIKEIVPDPAVYDETIPAPVDLRYDAFTPYRAEVVFNEPVDADGVKAANFSVRAAKGRPRIVSVSLSKDGRVATLEFDGIAGGAEHFIEMRNIANREKTAKMDKATRSFVAPDLAEIPRGAAAKVPEAKTGRLVFALDIPARGADFDKKSVEYAVDNSAKAGAFSRIGYYLELRKPRGRIKWVWVSMDAFSDDASKIGVPVKDSFQRMVSNLKWQSNDPAVGGGECKDGYIEFYPDGYNGKNAPEFKYASSGRCDHGDCRVENTFYGAMQVFRTDYESAPTLFAYNRWMRHAKGDGTGAQDLGIGDGRGARGGNNDWTFAENSGEYDLRRLEVFVMP